MEIDKIVRGVFNSVATIIISYISIKLFDIFKNINMYVMKYWVVIPIIIFLVLYAAQRIFKRQIFSTYSLLILTVISTAVTGVVIKIPEVNTLLINYEELLIVVIFFILFISLAINLNRKKDDSNITSEDKSELFNLFYINTSKVHEIAMLIDNKIMKTVEKEQSNQQILKSTLSMDFNKSGFGGASVKRDTENNNKTSVYESFDVKTTKSIMLRTIYSSIKEHDSKKKTLGGILLFKNLELKQRNTDDTVMVLNVLKDGNMKQLSNDDNFELNLSKMMDEMLDDFTIDYTFNYDGNNCLIRIPYKSKEYFENSYSHNDLQLGKLSVIGIYRGEINFSEIDSISSKFLELFSESYKNGLRQNNKLGVLESSSGKVGKEYEFNIKHNKLVGVHHLIDLIAIIQEINIKESDYSE